MIEVIRGFTLLFVCNFILIQSMAQNIDSVYVNDTLTYFAGNAGKFTLKHWEIDGGQIISENPSYSDSIIVIWGDSIGSFFLNVIESNQLNCYGEMSKLNVRLKEKPIVKQNVPLSVPNVISPNGDGVNDFFCISLENSTDFLIEIFNRWGKSVFTSDDSGFRWDGKFNQNDLPCGTYFYLISYKTLNSKELYRGNIQIYR